MFVSFNSDNTINVVSDAKIEVFGQEIKEIEHKDNVIGLKLIESEKGIKLKKEISNLRVAIICNWNSKCGISTYSQFLVNSIIPKVKEIKIFSEISSETTNKDEDFVERSWERGKNLLELSKKIKEWDPDFIIIQHEFGIFPNAFHFMQLLQHIDNIPYVVTLHSVYSHLDKFVYTSSIKNIVVHTEEGKNLLLSMGSNSNIFTIPHGCSVMDDVEELWNICLNPYTIVQFGFGFEYKGVEKMLDAIHHLKANDPKFDNIFYAYLLSTNENTKNVHNSYYEKLLNRIKELDIEKNVVIIRKYHTDKVINLYLRLFKLAVFPYVNNVNNNVYASSGAIRIAMANKTPVIASNSHLFDDLEGFVPRPADYLELSKEIDKIFSDSEYKKYLIEKSQEFIKNNDWNSIAVKYLDLYNQV